MSDLILPDDLSDIKRRASKSFPDNIGNTITNAIIKPKEKKTLNTKIINASELLLPDNTILSYNDIINDPTLEIVLPDDWMNFNINLKSEQLYMKNKAGLEIPITEDSVTWKLIEHYCNNKLLTGMENFTVARDTFTARGRYCEDKSTRMQDKFWEEETYKSINGTTINGTYVSGYNYFYWNYCPIDKVEAIDEFTARRVYSFCDLWDIDYYLFLYIEEAIKMGLHALVPKARRKGLSFKAAGMLNRNYHCIERSKGYAIADLSDFLDEDGITSKCWSQMNFIDMNTGFASRKQVHNTQDHKKASYWYVDKTTGVDIRLEGGLLSEIFSITTKGNVNKVRGKAGQLFILEEFGSNPQGEDLLNILRPSVEQGKKTLGLIMAYGTSGDAKGGFASLEKYVMSPSLMNFHSVANFTSKNRYTENIGFFIPDNICSDGYIDKNGNSDHIRAAVDLSLIRLKLKDDPQLLLKRCAETPLTINEFCLITDNEFFPSVELKMYLSELKTDPRLSKDRPDYGVLIKTSGRPRFDTSTSAVPILEFPNKDHKRDGCVIIYSHPIETFDRSIGGDSVMSDRYIASLDSVDWNANEVSAALNKTSLQSAFVMDKLTRNIVAEYTGRPNNVDDYFNQLRLLLDYYNAKILLEVNIRGALQYFRSRHLDKYLAQPPKVLQDKVNYKPTVSVGVKTNASINAFGRLQYNKWLKEEVPVYTDTSVDYYYRYRTIKSIGLLQETITWNPKGNFDRVSAISLLMIYLLECDTYSMLYVEEKTNRVDEFSKYFSSLDAGIKNKSKNMLHGQGVNNGTLNMW
jgi:hypothetical protein